MRYYLYNDYEKNYIGHTETKKIIKTQDINEATGFEYIKDAISMRKRATRKCQNYYVMDSETGKLYRGNRRKKYSDSERKIIYEKAGGKCQLCGKRLLYTDMTLDHIIPLAMNGEDEMENLQCACKACNGIKGCVLPEDFTKRVSDIFMYQMGKQYSGRFTWKLARILLCGKI